MDAELQRESALKVERSSWVQIFLGMLTCVRFFQKRKTQMEEMV